MSRRDDRRSAKRSRQSHRDIAFAALGTALKECGSARDAFEGTQAAPSLIALAIRVLVPVWNNVLASQDQIYDRTELAAWLREDFANPVRRKWLRRLASDIRVSALRR